VHDVSRLNHEELLALFMTLEAPGLDEMNGEYAAVLLDLPVRPARVTATPYNPLFPGHWLTKAFRPVSDQRGRGYNSFRYFGRVVQRFPMTTLIAPSRYDGRPAYQLVYRAFRSYCGFLHMVDEVRRLDERNYLCIGTLGFTQAARRIACPFLLTGPIAPYYRDTGTERTGFRVASELEALPARRGG
jgi:hypothetical protein